MPTFLSRPNLALRIALMVVAVFLLQNVLFGALMTYVSGATLRSTVERELQSEAEALVAVADAAAAVQPAPAPAAQEQTVTAAAPAPAAADGKLVEEAARIAAARLHASGLSSYRFRVLDDLGKVRVDTALGGGPVSREALAPGLRKVGEDLVATSRAHTAQLTVVASVDGDESLSGLQGLNSYALAGAVASLLLGLVGAVVIARQVTTPLRSLGDAARKIAETGDLDVQIEVSRGDEIGELANAFRQMTARMQEIIQTLHANVQRLTQASSDLSASTAQQAETLTRHAAALQETQATAQEIRQTSVLAAQKAESILQVADKGDLLGREGESALEQSVSSLSAIRAQVEDIARQIGALSQRAQQIESITQTVKDLANQSNMLALNAAIEASRSGEHGKGFAVVAREIRSLADQSIVATRQVRQILEDVTGRIAQAAEVTEQGARRMEAGLEQIRTSGDKLKELSNMVRDSSSAARQIAAAVSQQSAGIGEIFAAVTEQNRMMEETLERIGATTRAVQVVDQVSGDVVRIVEGRRAPQAN